MADNCKICNKCISHTQYNCSHGFCSRCYEDPYRDLHNEEQKEWIKLGSSCTEGGAD
jgi:hypothetical protein